MHTRLHPPFRFSAFLIGALFAAESAPALSPPPPEAGDELLPLLYETLGGEGWRNNDGWLDPETPWCDWHGVSCRTDEWGIDYLVDLELADNGLEGELTMELAEQLLVNFAPESRLDLSGNAITGELPFYPRTTRVVDLSDNALSGPLPPLEGDWILNDEQRLFLNRNAFSGTVPASWAQARLWWLDLSDNALTGGHMHAIDAISPSGTGFVYLTGNPLEGELTDAVLSAPLSERDEVGAYGGIDICFTKLTVDDPVVRDWLAEHHAASSDFEQCLNRDRTEIDATLSGSWYNSGRPGEGVSLMMLDNGAPLLYSFSFDTQGHQQWLFEVGTRDERSLQWEGLLETRGTFGEGIDYYQGEYAMTRGVANFRFDRTGADGLQVQRDYYDWSGCGDFKPDHPEVPLGPGLCVTPLHSDRMDYQRLTELAGTSCDNQSSFQQYSGAWYNPERSGEGFVVEVLPDDRAVVYWFTHTADGSGQQAWMIGQGVIGDPFISEDPPPANPLDAGIEIEDVIQPIGGTYGPDFDADAVEYVDWGRLLLHFREDGRSGTVGWISELEAYGSDHYEIERLARPILAECGQGENQ